MVVLERLLALTVLLAVCIVATGLGVEEETGSLLLITFRLASVVDVSVATLFRQSDAVVVAFGKS